MRAKTECRDIILQGIKTVSFLLSLKTFPRHIIEKGQHALKSRSTWGRTNLSVLLYPAAQKDQEADVVGGFQRNGSVYSKEKNYHLRSLWSLTQKNYSQLKKYYAFISQMSDLAYFTSNQTISILASAFQCGFLMKMC